MTRGGDWIEAMNPHPFWQVLPWVLIAAIAVFLLRRIRRAPPLA